MYKVVFDPSTRLLKVGYGSCPHKYAFIDFKKKDLFVGAILPLLSSYMDVFIYGKSWFKGTELVLFDVALPETFLFGGEQDKTFAVKI